MRWKDAGLDDHGAATVPLDSLYLHETKIKLWLPKILPKIRYHIFSFQVFAAKSKF